MSVLPTSFQLLISSSEETRRETCRLVFYYCITFLIGDLFFIDCRFVVELWHVEVLVFPCPILMIRKPIITGNILLFLLLFFCPLILTVFIHIDLLRNLMDDPNRDVRDACQEPFLPSDKKKVNESENGE